MNGTNPPRLSVVVACVDARETLRGSLAALDAACRGLAAEILVVHAADDPPPANVVAEFPGVRVIARRGRGLIPHLWTAGYRASRGSAVAFTTGHCAVGPQWARALLDELDAGAAGAGGPLALLPGAGPLGWALYYLRYSAFLPSGARGRVAEIAGDNAAYSRAALDREAATFADGFWEVEFHRRLRSAGGRLSMVPEAVAGIGASFALSTAVRQRFQHGIRCGADRAIAHGFSPWRGLAAVPVLPLLLLARVLRRCGRRADRARVLAASPLLLVLACAWTLGEAWGGWSARAVTSLSYLPKHGSMG